MKFPYTFAAKVAQFPYKMYFTQQWIWKYYAISVVLTIPLFYKIQKLGKLVKSQIAVASELLIFCYSISGNF